jgi:hypothetical protein
MPHKKNYKASNQEGCKAIPKEYIFLSTFLETLSQDTHEQHWNSEGMHHPA